MSDTWEAIAGALVAPQAAQASAFEELRRHYGLDLPVVTRLLTYLWHLIRLDLGFSAIYGKPVIDVIVEPSSGL